MIKSEEIKEIAINHEIEITHPNCNGKYQAFDGYHYHEFDSEDELLEHMKGL